MTDAEALTEAVSLVGQKEWSGGDCGGECPWCGEVRREGADRDGHAHDCNAYGFLVAHATATIKLATGATDCDECTICGGDAEDCDTDGVCPGARVRRLRAGSDQVVSRGRAAP